MNSFDKYWKNARERWRNIGDGKVRRRAALENPHQAIWMKEKYPHNGKSPAIQKG